MGHVDVQITLKNAFDVENYEHGLMAKPDIRQTTVEAMVDTGTTTLVINRELFQKLGLTIVGEKPVVFANDKYGTCKMTGMVEVQWENRSFAVPAMLVDDAPNVLLGVLPLEGMDLMVDTVNQTLVGAHGDQPKYRL